MEACSVQYANTKMDVYWYQITTASKTPLLWAIFAMPFMYIAISELSNDKNMVHGPVIGTISVIITSAVFTIPYVAFWFLFMAILVFTKKYSSIICEHNLTVSPDGIKETTSQNETLSNWSGYKRLVSTKNYLLIYIAEGNGYIIPKRRVSTIGDLALCEALVKKYSKEART